MISARNLRRNLRKAREFPLYAARVLLKRTLSTASYHLCRGWSAPPETVSILLTFQCNLRCKMCGQWGETGAALGLTDEVRRLALSLDDVRAVVEGVRSFSPAITLFGGEPLIYKDIIGAVEIIKGAGLRANIITNGTLLSRYAADLVRLGLDEIIFSLDGPPEIHDRVRNRAGVFRDAAEGFRLLAEAKKKLSSQRPVVNVNSTIFDFNYRRMSETFDTARSLGAEEITFHHLIFISAPMYAAHRELMVTLFDMPSCDWEGFVVDRLPEIDADILIDGAQGSEGAGGVSLPQPYRRGGEGVLWFFRIRPHQLQARVHESLDDGLYLPRRHDQTVSEQRGGDGKYQEGAFLGGLEWREIHRLSARGEETRPLPGVRALHGALPVLRPPSPSCRESPGEGG